MGFLKICILAITIAGPLANAKEKGETVKVKYELMHNVCDKGKCQMESLTKGTEVMELKQETDSHFWNYKPVNFKKNSLDIQIRFKAVLLKNKNNSRTFELGFAERKIVSMEQISWGESALEGSNWPLEYSMKVLGNSYDLNGKTITPSVKIEFIKN